MADVASLKQTKQRVADIHGGAARVARPTCVAVLGYPGVSETDELALHMLEALLPDTCASLEIATTRMLSAEMIALVQQRDYRIVCIADLPPSSASKLRYLIKKLRGTLPELKIVVGRWAPSSLVDDDVTPLVEAGATHVGSTLLETRGQIQLLAQHVLQQTGVVASSGAA